MSLLKLSRWQWTTIATLTVGYAAYYFCRSNFSVAGPLLLEEFGSQGLDKSTLGWIAAWGTTFYAFGKLFNGMGTDFIGGRQVFIYALLASVGATIVFGLGGGVTVFLVAWCFNRYVQSAGWGALVKTASRWFPTTLMGTVVGILCLSYLFGDFVAKLTLSGLIGLGLGWRGVFFSAAGIAGVIAFAAFFLLKNSPAEVGEPEPPANPKNLFGSAGEHARARDLLSLMLPFLTSVSFWLVCIMNFGLTSIREVFNFWTPTYLTEAALVSPETAALLSSLFPFFGGISVLAAGWLSDTLGKGKRGTVMFVFLIVSVLALFALSMLDLSQGISAWIPVVLISSIGLFMLGPYAFLSGVMSVDLGGKRGSSTAAGVADAVGYMGSSVSLGVVGSVAQHHGWSTAFGLLAGILAVTALIALLYWYLHEVRGTDVPTGLSELPIEAESQLD